MNSKKNQPTLTADKKIGLLVVQTSIEKKQGNSSKKARQRHKKVSQDVMSSEELLLLNNAAAGEGQKKNESQLSSYRQGSEVGRKAVFSQTIAVSPTAEQSQVSLAQPKPTNGHSSITLETASPAGKKAAQAQ